VEIPNFGALIARYLLWVSAISSTGQRPRTTQNGLGQAWWSSCLTRNNLGTKENGTEKDILKKCYPCSSLSLNIISRIGVNMGHVKWFFFGIGV
jgi:hypothetical protein